MKEEEIKMYEQFSLFDVYNFLDKPDIEKPIKMPEYDKELLKTTNTLDNIMNKLPRYLVTFKNPVFALHKPIKQKVCVYVGYWHSLDGWNYYNKNIEKWELLEMTHEEAARLHKKIKSENYT